MSRRPVRGARGSVAWVESPFQLLSVIESAAAGNLPSPVTAVTRGPDAAFAPLVGLLARHPVDGLTVGPAPRLSTAWRMVRRADSLVVGDVFSGISQILLVTTGRRSVVIVDDGSSTLAAIDQIWSAGAALVRPRSTLDRRRTALGRRALAVLRDRHERGRLAVSTGLPMELVGSAGRPDGARHVFSWTRCLDVAWGLPVGSHVVLGSALAADGLIDEACYRRWLSDRIAAIRSAGAPAVYVAHRRESAEAKTFVRSCGALVQPTTGLPVELVAHHAPPGTTFVTLPSTTALTLSAVAPQARIESFPIDDGWWTSDAPASMRALASMIASWSPALGASQSCTRVYARRVAHGASGGPHSPA